MNERKISINALEEIVIHNITKHLSELDINSEDEEEKTLLHLACQMGMVKLVNILLQCGASINVKDCLGRTPIMLACFAGHDNIVDILFSNNADINITDIYGFNILSLAVYGGFKAVKHLFDKKINSLSSNNYLGQMPLLAIACSVGNEDLVNFIIRQRTEEVNIAVKKSGMTPLMLAVCGGYTKIAKQLIAHGANPSVTSKASLSFNGYALKLSFPLLEFKTPELTFDDQVNHLGPGWSTEHPLTPNIYLSPAKTLSSPKKCLNWLKKSVRMKRSRSLDHKKKLTNINKYDKNDAHILKSIFQNARLQQYWHIFQEHQISFRIFLTLDEEDLCSIGITKLSVRNKILNLIEHYNHIFCL